ncbi:MAG TPA: glycosyltransferase family 2 protein [Tepidisphaeraceae bacterium]|jgi:glycosyltransferase involved in cell wall biosynthesis|nr:glycosyltransferase family 2 protein [Tepidisphaeraceae bacterium]
MPPTVPATQRAAVAIMILTKNEAINLPYTLASVAGWVDDVFVLDSGSTDATREVAEKFGATFVPHAWEGYAKQKNWGLDNLPFRSPWIFILDADEVVTPELREELIGVTNLPTTEETGYFVNRYFIFLEKRIRHCGYYPSWNLRLFRRGKARYEERAVHEHMVVDGRVGYLKHDMEHYDRRGLEDYIAKHNRYSTLEAEEMYRLERGVSDGSVTATPWGDAIQRRRWLKTRVWPRLPAKWLARFVYMYLYRLGIRDGVVGFHFCLFLASYEHQITMKLKALRMAGQGASSDNAGQLPSPDASVK